MTRKLFDVYQYLFPIVLTPLSFYLWWVSYDGQLFFTLLAWLLPILYAYIVPAVGTNVLKVWEFNTRFRLGRFRPHHGFVFGSATSMLAWLLHLGMADGLVDVVLTAFIFGVVLAVVNIVYDIKAINAGVLCVYNQPWAEGKDTRCIVMDYAPWFFGGFGIVYGVALATAEWLNNHYELSVMQMLLYVIAALVLTILIPVIGYRHQSFKRHGHSGCYPIKKT